MGAVSTTMYGHFKDTTLSTTECILFYDCRLFGHPKSPEAPNILPDPSIHIAVHHVRTYLKDTLNLQSLTHTCVRKISATHHQPRKKADSPIPIISCNVDYNVDTCCKFSLEANLRTTFYVNKIPHVVAHLPMPPPRPPAPWSLEVTCTHNTMHTQFAHSPSSHTSVLYRRISPLY